MILLPLWEGWDGACSGWDGAVVFWMGLWWNSFPLGKAGMGLVVFWMGLWWNSFPLGKVGMGLTPGNSVGVAFSRRRYTQSDNTVLYSSAHCPGARNACG